MLLDGDDGDDDKYDEDGLVATGQHVCTVDDGDDSDYDEDDDEDEDGDDYEDYDNDDDEEEEEYVA